MGGWAAPQRPKERGEPLQSLARSSPTAAARRGVLAPALPRAPAAELGPVSNGPLSVAAVPRALRGDVGSCGA